MTWEEMVETAVGICSGCTVGGNCYLSQKLPVSEKLDVGAVL